MTVRSAWLTSPGQTREDTRRAPLGTMTPIDESQARSGVIPGGNPYALSDTGAMTFEIGPGRSTVQGTLAQGAYGHVVTAAEGPLTVTDGDAALDRIDSVYLVVYDDLYDASGMTAATVALVDGDPATVPTAPEPPTPSSLRLYDITVPAGTSAGTGGIDWAGSAVTDVRPYTVAVGGINPGGGSVAGAYVGQWRDNNGVLERFDGTSWVVRSPHAGATFDGDLLLSATGELTIGGDTGIYRGGPDDLRTDDTFTALVETSGTVTMAAGFTLTEAFLRKACGICTVTVYAVCETQIDTTSFGGNIPDTDFCTLPFFWRPANDFETVWSNGFVSGSASINPAGLVQLRTSDYQTEIQADSNVRMSATYVL